ncbi:hypothetical protein [Cupriavidus consociatus]|uniref:hypothetical protein n=1 Tax=Cupriavidus consociatus TaxID=2821357 RepID=UPI001AE3CCA3|nr:MULTISPECIES: hypothetical protein [unclassified Cupriavidus]MBP0625432.1 hypothetical protein [Cupriavidus sp. LEh25]MDK2662172.1 hypothetical protein [Cupriavidus sp. LEh21]
MHTIRGGFATAGASHLSTIDRNDLSAPMLPPIFGAFEQSRQMLLLRRFILSDAIKLCIQMVMKAH